MRTMGGSASGMGRSGASGGRTWLRWLLLIVFVVGLAFTFVRLGEWQLYRLDQRRHRNDVIARHEASPVVDYATIMNRPLGEDDQWQRVRATGTFVTDRQLIVRYRSNDGKTGWEVVTPLRTTDGRTVLIDRGFVERQPGTDFPTVLPEPPAGEVTVVGHVRRNEQGDEKATTPQQGSIRLINSDALATWVGTPLVNGYIGLLEVTPPQTGGFQPVAVPALDEGPHLSYALQWFAFTVIAGVGLVILIRNDVRDRRRARERAASDQAADRAGETPAGSPRATTDDAVDSRS